MNLLELFHEFSDNDKAIAYLESVRWKEGVVCPYCKSDKTCKHEVRNRVKKWQCWNCNHSFSVTVGTIFHHTHMPLNKWFWLIALMLNDKKEISAYKASKELGMNRPTVCSMMKRIKNAMGTPQMDLLKGIIEMDECNIKNINDLNKKNLFIDDNLLSLTDEGEKLLNDSGFKYIFENVKDDLIKKFVEEINPKNQYDTQERARQWMDDLSRKEYEPFIPIKSYAFKTGSDYAQILRAGSILLRDYYLEKHLKI